MKNLSNRAFELGKAKELRSVVAHTMRLAMLVVLLLTIGVGKMWGNYTPGSGYTKVTNPSSQLTVYDQVILYEEATGMAVTGSDGTDATLSSTAAAWTKFKVEYVSGSTVELSDISSSVTTIALKAVSEGTHYNFVIEGVANEEFTINSSGLLQYSGTRLAHDGNHVRFYTSAGTPLYVYKLDTPDPLAPASNAGLELGPANIYISAKANNGESPYGLFYSGMLSYESTGYKKVEHEIIIIDDDFPDDMWLTLLDDYAEGWSGHFTPSSNSEFGSFQLYGYAPEAGIFHATLKLIEHGTNNYVTVPITITVTSDCTSRTLTATNSTTQVLEVGDTYKRSSWLSIAPNVTGGTPSFRSSNPSVATVSSDGTVTAVAAGSANIYVTLGATTVSEIDYCKTNEVSYPVHVCGKISDKKFTLYKSSPTWSSTNGWTITVNSTSYITNAVTYKYSLLRYNESTSEYDVDAGAAYPLSLDATYESGGNYYYYTSIQVPCYNLQEGYRYALEAWGVNSCGTESEHTRIEDMEVSCVDLTGAVAITVSDQTTTSATVSWGGVSTATTGGISSTIKYDVIITQHDNSSVVYSQSNSTATSKAFAVNDLIAGKTYDVSVTAKNDCGSTLSSSTSFVTVTYGEYVFSCADLTLTGPTGDLVFVTSTAGKMVRSQEAFHLTGSALTPSTAFTFSFGNAALNELFDFKLADGGTVQTDASGNIDEDIYVFYTPSGTTDGLDKATNLTVAMSGVKPKTATLNTKTIIGRHLPAQFVIAGKKDNKWWALPSNMASTSTPAPVEIAVNDINNPSLAYTAASNVYGLEGPTTSGSGNNISTGNGQYVRLTMSISDGNNPAGPAPLLGSSSTASIGKSGNAQATNNLSAGWWWELKQTNTSISNPQEAKYNIYCANNTTNHLRIKDNAGNPEWGLYDSGVEELRLIPASVTPNIVAKVVEWGQHGAILEAAPTKNSVTAISVIGTLNEVSSSPIELAQTRTSVKNSATAYNFTVNFGNTIDFAAAESNGALLLLQWMNGETLVGVSNIVVPKIIATSASMSSLINTDDPWKTEVHVLPNVTLTADAGTFLSGDVRINQLEIYPKATVNVTTGTLEVASLVLRNGWTRVGSKAYDVARVFINSDANMTKSNQTENWYVDWYIDYDQYYPIAVPFPVSITDRPYKNATGLSYDGNLMLRYYDGASRAGVSGSPVNGSNWKKYGEDDNESYPRTLVPGKGYAMSAKRPTGRAFSIIRMPMTYTKPADMNPWLALGEQGSATITGGLTHKDQVQVTGWGKGTAQWYAMGWNFIGNPYMSVFNGDDEGISGKIEEQDGKGVRYATIPDVYFENFDQVVIAQANLKPASGFFIQANSTDAQTLTFSKSKIVPPSAAPRYMKLDESVPEQEAYIRLEYEGGKDQMGLIIGDDYTEAYEPDADLAKILGEGNYVKTYMHYSDMDLAYVAINETLAKNWIPVTVKIPAAGEYTFSLMNSSSVEALEGLYLIDYANGDKVTNLIEESYTFSEVAGTFAERFAINAIYGARQTPTGADVVSDGTINSDEPIKFLYREKVYILYHGVIYDATGKKVREINK